MDALVSLLRDGDDVGKRAAARALDKLASGDGADADARRDAIVAAGGVDALLSLLRNGSDADKSAADGALGKLALGEGAGAGARRDAVNRWRHLAN